MELKILPISKIKYEYIDKDIVSFRDTQDMKN